MKRWILMHLFPDIVAYLRMNAAYSDHSSMPARVLLELYGLGDGEFKTRKYNIEREGA